MKKSRIAIAAASAFMLFSANALSQDLKTGFFLDNYLYGYRMNPAVKTEVSNTFFGLVINDATFGASSDIGLSNILFPYNGGLVTGFNKNISAQEFLGGLKVSNKITADANENLFAFGHRTRNGKGLWTIEANLKSYSSAAAPMTMFEYLKVGASDNVYRMKNILFNSKNYGELALGYSRKVTDRLTVGATMKGILGFAYADMVIENLSIDTRRRPTLSSGSGIFVGACPFADIPTTSDGYLDFQAIKKGPLGISGIGAAIDLGIEYELIDGLTVSMAVLDLGAIAWKKSVEGVLGDYTFDILNNKDLSDNLASMMKFESVPVSGEALDILNTLVNFGARYTLPFAEKVSLGYLYSLRAGHSTSKYTDFRTGVTYTPGRALSVTGNIGVNTFGTTVGAAFTLNAGPVNLFAGIDGIFVNVTPQFIPINALNTVAKAGLSFAFGH